MDKFQSVCTPYIFKYDASDEQGDKGKELAQFFKLINNYVY